MSGTLRSAVRRRLAAQGGFTLVEMAMVLAILGLVLGAMTQLFVSATNAQIDLTNRFNAQQNARLALDSLRREIHCANVITGAPGSNVTITLGGFCPTNGTPGTTGYAVWCTRSLTTTGTLSGTATSRNGLYRYFTGSAATAAAVTSANCGSVVNTVTPVKKADYLTTGTVFTGYNYGGAGGGSRATLSIDLPVDLTPATATIGKYELKDDIVLRNTSR